MIRFLLLLLLITAPSLAFAEEDMEKDLRDLQKNAESMLKGIGESTASAPGHLDIARRKIFALAENKPFLNAMNQLWASPNRNTLLIVDGIFFVVIFLLRSWRQAKASNWFTKVLVGLVFTIILWGGLSYVIPAFVLGEPYRIFVAGLWNVLVSS